MRLLLRTTGLGFQRLPLLGNLLTIPMMLFCPLALCDTGSCVSFPLLLLQGALKIVPVLHSLQA
jgi:hypothetical protein